MTQNIKALIVGVVAAILLQQGIAHALDKPISPLLEDNVSVTTTAQEVRTLSSVAAGSSFDSVWISNSSTTCIRVGGSTVTNARGAIIGSGCYDGPNINIDAKSAFLISESGTVNNVRLLFGVRQ